MNITVISSANFKAIQTKKLIPLSEYKGPILKLTTKESQQVKLLEDEINRLNIECYHIIRTLNINKNLTGYQKDMSRYRLCHLTESINSIKSQINDIKKSRYASQMQKFKNKLG